MSQVSLSQAGWTVRIACTNAAGRHPGTSSGVRPRARGTVAEEQERRAPWDSHESPGAGYAAGAMSGAELPTKENHIIVWLDGDTERVAGGGSLSCAAGPGGGGCFGFAWWQNDADYNASIWDLDGLESAGTVSADVSGTSFLPALVVPIPFIARTQSKACKTLADQLHNFIVAEESA